MSDHDLNELRRSLQAIPGLANLLAQRVTDLHTLAFDRHTNGEAGRSGTLASELDPLAGSPEAKDVWKKVLRATHNTVVEFSAACVAANELLNAGGLPNNTMRGSMLGDDHTPASAELAALVKRQRARIERGEYVPNREWFQPQVPRR